MLTPSDTSHAHHPVQALKEVEALRQALANYDKDKLSLAQTKARLVAAEKQVRVCVCACRGLRAWEGAALGESHVVRPSLPQVLSCGGAVACTCTAWGACGTGPHRCLTMPTRHALTLLTR